MNRMQFVFESEIGPLYLVASDKGLEGLHWTLQDVPATRDLEKKDRAHSILQITCEQLTQYFAYSLKDFKIPLDVSGTPFQTEVWKKLMDIPYGSTLSYKQLASSMGSPQAVRAVATANARNPLCIIVPCHRVINSSGKLGGYSGGLKLKERLIQLEKLHTR